MRRIVALGLAVACFTPALARAHDYSGCYLGPSDLDHCAVSGTPAAILAGIAAPVLVAGAAVTAAQELRKHTTELAPVPGAVTNPGANGKPQTSLMLVPPSSAYAAGASEHAATAPGAAFRFNDAATNIATVAAGAMVVGAIAATIAGAAKHK
jgi:hypothetical protein